MAKTAKTTKPSFSSLQDLFADFQLDDKGGYITQEFQDFGYRLAVELDDLKHKSLYIKMSKELPRGLLETALSFVSDANARNKARLFMWKVNDLKKSLPSTTKKK
ncbi:MAG TPA: hypothetical protein VD999_02545 [Vitreimonas sp.]|nr:hypothetical protein [Vitreimonas sp.]